MKNNFTILSLLILVFINSCSKNNSDNNTSSPPAIVVPASPSGLKASVNSPTQVNLIWIHNSSNETGYTIERKTGVGTFAAINTTSANVTTYNDIGLIANTTYSYRVIAFNSAGNSSNYTNEVAITTLAILTDIDGNVYPIINLCNQVWTKTNLNVNRYRNGDIIPEIQDPIQWANSTTGAWCYYNNTPAQGNIYGKLYNWAAVIDPRGLAPVGWHIPTASDWNILIKCVDPIADTTFVGTQSSFAGGSMKESGTTHWQSPNTGATNISLFTSLPSGYRVDVPSAIFSNIGTNGTYWSSIELNSQIAYVMSLSYNSNYSASNYLNKSIGLAVRCVKN